ncbi:uncharacterized protein LOC134782458 [Penaeus indicus]|uniref:uncharacterized protein LOC134782458 n=1 Tax=Penaeus indicus TaxID=29960 RepID=UPI00300DB1EC
MGGRGQVGSLYASHYGLGGVFRRRLHPIMRSRGFTPHWRPPGGFRTALQARPHTTRSSCSKVNKNNLSWHFLVLLMGQNVQLQTVEKLKEVTRYLVRIVVRQCEVHTSERIRRSMQLYTVYSRMWGEEAARRLLSNLRRIFLMRGRHLLLSAVCITQYDWDNEKISEESLERATDDLESVGELCKATVQCESCGKRQVIDQQMSNVDYCMCRGSIGYAGKNRYYDSWEPFIERDHHIVWRQRHHVHQHLFAYKVYGTYDDVSLSAFMEAQLNSGFRKEWDDSVLELRVLDSHAESNSDLVYWLVKFPQFFANRDYVFKRRFTYNEERQEAVIMSQAVDSNVFPEEKGIYRVNEYWSTMVIRASDSIDKPGIEYTLTYFDNPGTSLPQSITNFIAATGFPNFLRKVHQAALSLQTDHENGGDAYISLPNQLRYPKGMPEIEKPTISVSVEEEGALVPATEELETVSVGNIMGQVLEHGVSIPKIQGEEEKHSAQSDLLEECARTGSLIRTDSEGGGTPKDTLLDKNAPTLKEETREDNSEFLESSEIDVEMEMQMTDEIKSSDLNEDDHLSSTIDTNSNHSSLSQDLSLQLSRKKVVVDILEAMEVVAPDMDEKTKLSQKVEELAAITSEKIENKSVLLAKLDKLKNKLKEFQENAFHRKLTSLEKMQELENRGHYDHSSLDEKTLKHLENLFHAVNRVLQADKDMRTGKGYLKTSTGQNSDTSKEEQLFWGFQRQENRDKEDTGAQPSEQRIPDEVSASPGFETSQKKDATDEIKPKENVPRPVSSDVRKEGELSIQDFQRRESKKREDTSTQSSEHTVPDEVSASPGCDSSQKKKVTDKSKPPDDPPGPISAESSATAVLEEGTKNEIKTSSNDMRNNIENRSSSSGWASWLYFPFSTSWIDVKAAQDVSNSGRNNTVENHVENLETHSETKATALIAQAWYIVGLGWIFQTESQSAQEICDPQPSETQAKGEDVGAVEVKCDKGTEGTTSWYWYPMNGMYRVYTWVFSASQKESV